MPFGGNIVTNLAVVFLSAS